MSKYRSFPLISGNNRASKVKRVAEQPENDTEADPRATTSTPAHAFGLGYPTVLINHDLHLLR